LSRSSNNIAPHRANDNGVVFGDGPIVFKTGISEKRLAGRRGSEPAAASKKQSHDHQQYDGADRGIDDLTHEAGADGNAEPWKQQTGDQRAGDTDENIADDAKAGARTTCPASQPAIRPTNRITRMLSLDMRIEISPHWFTRFFPLLSNLSIIA
jgi:hypothetical protein